MTSDTSTPDVSSPDLTALNQSAGTSTEVRSGSDRWYLSAAPLWRALLHLCVPMAAGFSVGAVYNLINAGFIGSLHDTALLAAITFGLPLLGIVMAVGGVFGVGAGALISRLLGAAETDPVRVGDIRYASSFALWGSVVVGAVVGGAGLALLHPLVRLLGADAAAVPATTSYVAVMLVFVPVLAAAFCLEQLVRAEGAARQSMIGLIASTVANLVLDVIFILGLGWGVTGAALALGLSNLVAVGYYVWFLQRRSEHVDLSIRWFRLSPGIVRPVLGVGVGELLQSGFLIATSLVLNNLAVAYGDGPLAAFGVALRIVQLPEFLVMGVSIGVLPLLAYSYGKGDPVRLARALRASAAAVAMIVLVFSGAVFLLRHQVLGIFSASPEVVAIGIVVLTAQLAATVVNGFTALVTSYFQATGQAAAAVMMSVAQGVVFIPVVLLGNAWFGLDGIIWAMTVTEVIVFGLGAALWLRTRRAVAAGLALGTGDSTAAADIAANTDTAASTESTGSTAPAVSTRTAQPTEVTLTSGRARATSTG